MEKVIEKIKIIMLSMKRRIKLRNKLLDFYRILNLNLFKSINY